jgi:hypothetical protein
MSLPRVLHSIGQIAQQVETISDLNCVRRSAPRTVCVTARPVTTEELDARMSTQSRDECVQFAVRKQVDDMMPLKINENRPISLTFAPCPIVHA